MIQRQLACSLHKNNRNLLLAITVRSGSDRQGTKQEKESARYCCSIGDGQQSNHCQQVLIQIPIPRSLYSKRVLSKAAG